jgi:hypothetical protein
MVGRNPQASKYGRRSPSWSKSTCSHWQPAARARDEGGGAARPGRAGHVPGVGRDQPHLADGNAEPFGRHQVGLGGRLEPAHGVGRQNHLEGLQQAGMLQLGPGDLLGRVGQRGQPLTSNTCTRRIMACWGRRA